MLTITVNSFGMLPKMSFEERARNHYLIKALRALQNTPKKKIKYDKEITKFIRPEDPKISTRYIFSCPLNEDKTYMNITLKINQYTHKPEEIFLEVSKTKLGNRGWNTESSSKTPIETEYKSTNEVINLIINKIIELFPEALSPLLQAKIQAKLGKLQAKKDLDERINYMLNKYKDFEIRQKYGDKKIRAPKFLLRMKQ